MTDEQWNLLKPLAIAQRAAIAKYNAWQVTAVREAGPDFEEHCLLGMRLRTETLAAATAYDEHCRTVGLIK